MATSKNNIITHGLSGKVGDILVFSQRAGKTIVGKVPEKTHVPLSEKQKQVNARFQEAVIYARGAIADENQKNAYAQNAGDGKSAYNVAIADFFNAPDIETIDLSGYTGKPGEKIIIKAFDDFKVKQVTVEIYNHDGTTVEKGDALPDASGLQWIYTTTAVNEQLAGDKIIVKASDIPGNITESKKEL